LTKSWAWGLASKSLEQLLKHSRWNGPFHVQDRCWAFRDMRDGTSNTLAVGERARHNRKPTHDKLFNYWYIGTPDAQDQHSQFSGSTGIPLNTPDTGEYGYAGFRSYHPGGVQFAVCDGSATFISEIVDPDVMKALGTRRGGEPVSLP